MNNDVITLRVGMVFRVKDAGKVTIKDIRPIIDYWRDKTYTKIDFQETDISLFAEDILREMNNIFFLETT